MQWFRAASSAARWLYSAFSNAIDCLRGVNWLGIGRVFLSGGTQILRQERSGALVFQVGNSRGNSTH